MGSKGLTLTFELGTRQKHAVIGHSRTNRANVFLNLLTLGAATAMQ